MLVSSNQLTLFPVVPSLIQMVIADVFCFVTVPAKTGDLQSRATDNIHLPNLNDEGHELGMQERRQGDIPSDRHSGYDPPLR